MEQSPNTSFIPKQAGGAVKLKQRRSFNVLTFFATIVFLGVLGFAVSVFFYQRYVDNDLEIKKATLETLSESFTRSDLDDLRDLQSKIDTATALLDQHLSLTAVFAALHMDTQSNAQLKDFSFKRLSSGSAQIMLSGDAATYNTAALQRDEFQKATIFEKGSVVFSDVVKIKEDGKAGKEFVTFKASAQLDRDTVAYRIVSTSTSATGTNPTANASSTGEAGVTMRATSTTP